MQTKQQAEEKADGEKRIHQQLHAIVGEQVMHGLGQPAGFHRIQVRKLWDNRYRVNVYTGTEPTSAIVAHSYFLVTDEAGNIVTATPRITKRY